MRPATVRAPATEICWPTIARTAVSNGSTLPGHAQARDGGDGRRQRRVVAERGVDGDGIGVEVEQPADAPHGGPEIAPVGEPQARPHAGRGRRRREQRRQSTPWPCGRSSARWNASPSHASTPGTARAARNAANCVAVERFAHGQVELDDADG